MLAMQREGRNAKELSQEIEKRVHNKDLNYAQLFLDLDDILGVD